MSILLAAAAVLALSASTVGVEEPLQLGIVCSFFEETSESKVSKRYDLDILLPQNEFLKNSADGILTHDPDGLMGGQTFRVWNSDSENEKLTAALHTDNYPNNGFIMVLGPQLEDQKFAALVQNSSNKKIIYGTCAIVYLHKSAYQKIIIDRASK